MKLRQALACELTPIALRLALAAAFLFAGWNKVFVQREYTPEELATLASMGVGGAIRAASPPGAEAAPAPDKKESQAPGTAAPGAPLPEPGKQRRSAGASLIAAAPMAELPALAETEAVAAPAQAADMASQPVFDPARFSGPVKLKSVYILAIMLRSSAHPATGSSQRALWPPALASGPWPVRWAWAAALTELIGGGLVLIGFLTRFAGLALAGVMCVASWLTVFGPNLGADGAFLGILPRFPTSSTPPELAMAAFNSWQMFMLQWALLMCAVGVLLSGAGALSLDRFVFGKSKPRAAQPAPAE